MERPPRSFWQIWNMNFGFFGIQFAWGLQMANMSAIYSYLGANADSLAILWLAAPVTGVIIQPLIGQASDRVWTRLGRRRPSRPHVRSLAIPTMGCTNNPVSGAASHKIGI